VVVARRRRAHHDYDPDELRDRLHRRLAEVTGDGDADGSGSGGAALGPGA
jgi:hypothetical protein